MPKCTFLTVLAFRHWDVGHINIFANLWFWFWSVTLLGNLTAQLALRACAVPSSASVELCLVCRSRNLSLLAEAVACVFPSASLPLPLRLFQTQVF